MIMTCGVPNLNLLPDSRYFKHILQEPILVVKGMVAALTCAYIDPVGSFVPVRPFMIVDLAPQVIQN